MTAAEQYADALRVLGEMRGAVEAGTPGPWAASVADPNDVLDATWVVEWATEAFIASVHHDAEAHKIVTAVNALGPLLDLAEAVLGRHAPTRCCDNCGDIVICTAGGHDVWPCPDAWAVLGALGIGNNETEESE